MRVTKVWFGLISLNNYVPGIGTEAASPSSHSLLTSSFHKEVHRPSPFKSNRHDSSERDTAFQFYNWENGTDSERGSHLPKVLKNSSSKTEPKFKFLSDSTVSDSVPLAFQKRPKWGPWLTNWSLHLSHFLATGGGKLRLGSLSSWRWRGWGEWGLRSYQVITPCAWRG